MSWSFTEEIASAIKIILNLGFLCLLWGFQIFKRRVQKMTVLLNAQLWFLHETFMEVNLLLTLNKQIVYGSEFIINDQQTNCLWKWIYY